jgi:hypothetical protein
MFAKLATVIVVLGAMFGALLVNRQQRIDAASEISRIHFRMFKHERTRTNLQAQVAAAVRPDRLRDKVVAVAVKQGGGPGAKAGRAAGDAILQAFKPIPFRSSPSSATEESLGSLGEELATGDSQRIGSKKVGSKKELGG